MLHFIVLAILSEPHMNQVIIVEKRCQNCRVIVSRHDRCCRQCDQVSEFRQATYIDANISQVAARAPSSSTPPALAALRPEPSLITKVLENRLYVVGILLGVGPIGLPALWLSHRFSRRAKISVTLFYFAATVVMPLVAAWYLCDIALRPIVEALG